MPVLHGAKLLLGVRPRPAPLFVRIGVAVRAHRNGPFRSPVLFDTFGWVEMVPRQKRASAYGTAEAHFTAQLRYRSGLPDVAHACSTPFLQLVRRDRTPIGCSWHTHVGNPRPSVTRREIQGFHACQVAFHCRGARCANSTLTQREYPAAACQDALPRARGALVAARDARCACANPRAPTWRGSRGERMKGARAQGSDFPTSPALTLALSRRERGR